MLFLKIPVFVGSITTIICGIFHFFLPRLYGWRKYLKTLPGDFRRGVLATNYFLGIILFSIGIFSYIVMAFINPDSVIFRVWMSMMVVMWFFRLLYHLKHPLGKALKLYTPMSAICYLSVICFLEGFLLTFLK